MHVWSQETVMSVIPETSLEMFRGDTAQINALVKTGNAVFDLTSAAVKFTARRQVTDGEPFFQKTSGGGGGITITNAMQGTLAVEIAPVDTASLEDESTLLVWDIEITRGGQVFTVAHGDLRVILDVTRP